MPRYASMIYTGYWWSPERLALQALIDQTQQTVNGWVRIKLYKGNVIVVARDSKTDSLFDPTIATFEDDQAPTTRRMPTASSASTRCACASQPTPRTNGG